MPHRKTSASAPTMVSPHEVACFAYCPEQFRLQYGLGLKPENRDALSAGTRHHADRATTERLAGGANRLGRCLAVLAALALLLLWVLQ